MIDNSALYEKVLVEDGLNNVKHLRDQWNYSSENTLLGGLILFPDRKCNEISEQNLRQTRCLPKIIMVIYGRERERSMAQILPERCCSFY